MGADFHARKRLGTDAETALRRLFTAHGALVECHQQNADALGGIGAAVAHGAAAQHQVPDLTVTWPKRWKLRSYRVEVKAKSPLRSGAGWGWDVRAFNRALAWSEMTGDPVFYAVRDLSAAPLPAHGLDDPDHWSVASTWKLAHASADRTSDDRYHYWPAATFLPLAVLLDGLEVEMHTLPILNLGRDAAPVLL
jgi:hypothetical protein